MSLQDEIKEMMMRESIEDSEVSNDNPTPETSVDFVPETDTPVEIESEDAQGEVEEESEDSRYSKLLESFNQISSELSNLKQGMGVESLSRDSNIPPKEESVVPMTPSPQVDFSVDEKLLERALIEDDPAAMKQVLMSIVGSLTAQRESWRESVLRDIPMVTRDVARQQIVLMKAVDKFYTDNSDLIPYQGVVGNVTNQISAAHPEYSLGQLFEEVEKNVRHTLGLKRQAKRRDSEEKPAFISKANSRKPGPPKLDGIKAEIAAMKNARY